ncbi:hypothetical protein IPZ58_07625 [Streptomyces roseoverticillatus]|uniref:hypothetical protein n=1 Tax=Streptomyces roseoverticillatus TaxID=66429 RepID=UPI001F36CDF4|nr:hypothetical protein [Streptomyces roseoverticillatus]MCF3101449.1 hypothetical protein [Streptomyces roseoverticillatus]
MGESFIPAGTLVIYHGSRPDRHGLHIAMPCPCGDCGSLKALSGETRYTLQDPSGLTPGLSHVHRDSITPHHRGDE